jgi:hypothetical protein
MVVSSRASLPPDEVTQDPWWLQVYVLRDRGLTRDAVQRAAAAGARALVLTGDTPYVATKLRGPGPDQVRRPPERQQDPSVGLDAISWLREVSGLPVLVKGLLTAEDAGAALDAAAELRHQLLPLLRRHHVEVERHLGNAVDGPDLARDLLLERVAERAARDRERDRDGDAAAVDLDAADHVELRHGLAELGVDDAAERGDDRVAGGLHGRHGTRATRPWACSYCPSAARGA